MILDSDAGDFVIVGLWTRKRMERGGGKYEGKSWRRRRTEKEKERKYFLFGGEEIQKGKILGEG